MLDRSTRGNNLAKSAIETALLDLQGKRLNRPVSDLLGGALHQHPGASDPGQRRYR